MNVSALPPDSEAQPSQSAPRVKGLRGRETEAAHLVELMALSARGHEDAFA